MALRLIEMVLQEKDGGEVRELLKEHKVLEHRQVRLQDSSTASLCSASNRIRTSTSPFLVNLICVNLAGVTTFLVQGIRPATWWENTRAVKATRIAIGLWVVLLAALGGLILLLRKG